MTSTLKSAPGFIAISLSIQIHLKIRARELLAESRKYLEMVLDLDLKETAAHLGLLPL